MHTSLETCLLGGAPLFTKAFNGGFKTKDVAPYVLCKVTDSFKCIVFSYLKSVSYSFVKNKLYIMFCMC